MHLSQGEGHVKVAKTQQLCRPQNSNWERFYPIIKCSERKSEITKGGTVFGYIKKDDDILRVNINAK